MLYLIIQTPAGYEMHEAAHAAEYCKRLNEVLDATIGGYRGKYYEILTIPVSYEEAVEDLSYFNQ